MYQKRIELISYRNLFKHIDFAFKLFSLKILIITSEQKGIIK